MTDSASTLHLKCLRMIKIQNKSAGVTGANHAGAFLFMAAGYSPGPPASNSVR